MWHCGGYLDLRRMRQQRTGENYILRRFMICALHRMSRVIRMGWAGHVARVVERRGAYWVLVGEPEGKKTTC
jgi:hypothetical protein